MRARLPALLASLVIAASVQAAPTNLVVNGSFEDNTVNNGKHVNLSSINGWAVVGGPGTGFEVRHNNVGAAHDGNNFIELDTNGNTTIQQLFSSLTAGQSYDLSFWYSPRIDQPSTTNGISVLWNGQSLAGTITADGGKKNLWTEYHFTVAAQSGANTLAFAALGNSDTLGGNLDGVSLIAQTAPVPEPASVGLMALGLGVLACVRRRKA